MSVAVCQCESDAIREPLCDLRRSELKPTFSSWVTNVSSLLAQIFKHVAIFSSTFVPPYSRRLTEFCRLEISAKAAAFWLCPARQCIGMASGNHFNEAENLVKVDCDGHRHNHFKPCKQNCRCLFLASSRNDDGEV
ncbi:hypothetical protein D918_05967 [Trichuris suis]|nr:hypothetical protein D918_05967 [Trichuris suis]